MPDEVKIARADMAGNPPSPYMVILSYGHAIRADIRNVVVSRMLRAPQNRCRRAGDVDLMFAS